MTKFSAVSDDDTELDEQDVDETEYSDDVTEVNNSDDKSNSTPDDVDDTDEKDVSDEAKVEKNIVAKNRKSATVSGKDYQVLYRKFRPIKFSDVVGQENVIRGLRAAVINNKIANAYLFTGERGTGKTSTARILATALNCPNVKNGEPCGVCDLCVNVHEGNGSDGVTELDAASNSSVDDMRRLINEVQFARGSNKNVYIIDEVHLLSKAANGLLLKTLEEPPRNVVFILCTTNPERLEPAIRSRAIPQNFRELDDTTMQKLVEDIIEAENIELTAEQISGVVRKGKGSPRDALSALEALSLNTDAKMEHENHAALITNAISQKDVSKIIIAIAKAIEGGLSITEISTLLLSYWRSILLILNAPDMVRLTDDEFNAVSKVAETIGTDKTIYMLRNLGEAHSRLTQGDPRVMLETTLIQFVIPHNDTAAIKDIGRKINELGEDIADLKKRPASSPFENKPVEENWLDSKPKETTKKQPDEEIFTKNNEDKAVSNSRIPIIKDPDDLIDAIFDAAPKSLSLAMPELDVDTKKTTSELLQLRSYCSVSDEMFQTLVDVVAKVDPRDFDLDES